MEIYDILGFKTSGVSKQDSPKKSFDICGPKHLVKSNVKKGLMHSTRASFYFKYSYGEQLYTQYPHLYQDLIQDPCPELVGIIGEIDRDLYRTFPDNIKYKTQAKYSGALNSNTTLNGSFLDDFNEENIYIISLRRILISFAYYSTNYTKKTRRSSYIIGYCQSLNFVAGLLLLLAATENIDVMQCYESKNVATILNVEQKVFWTMAGLIEYILPPEMYGEALFGSIIQQRILWDCIINQDGKVGFERLISWSHDLEIFPNKNNGRDLSMATTPWFLSLFTTTLPINA